MNHSRGRSSERLTDFKELQKQHRKKKVLRRLVFVAVAAVGLMAFFMLGRQMNDFSLSSILGSLSHQGEEGLPANLSIGTVKDMQAVGGKIGLLGDSSFSLYTTNGRRQREVRHNYYNPVMEVGDNRVLLYDRDGINLQVEGTDKTLYTNTYENSIITAALNDKGLLAVATNSQKFKGEVAVYNRSFENIFNWGCAKGRILCLDLADRDNRMAVGTVEVTGGMIRSVVNLFKFTSDKEVAQIHLDDQLLLSLNYKGKDNTLYAVTDKNVYSLSADGAILAKYSFDGESLWAFHNQGLQGVSIVLGDYQERRELSVYRLDRDLNCTAPSIVGEHMLNLFQDREETYLLTDNFLYRFDGQMQMLNTYDLPDAKFALPLKGKVYYTTGSQLNMAEANQ